MKTILTYTISLILFSCAQSALAHGFGGSSNYKFDDAPSHDEEAEREAEEAARNKENWDQFMKLVDQQSQDTSHHENNDGKQQADDGPCLSTADIDERCSHMAEPDTGG